MVVVEDKSNTQIPQPAQPLNTSTSSDPGSDEELVDYTEHEQAEMGVLNRLWYKEAVFYEVCVILLFTIHNIHGTYGRCT